MFTLGEASVSITGHLYMYLETGYPTDPLYEVIAPIVFPTFGALQDLQISPQDKDRFHAVPVTMDALRQQDFNLIDWPPY